MRGCVEGTTFLQRFFFLTFPQIAKVDEAIVGWCKMKRRRTGRREDEERDDDKAQDELDEGLEGLQQVAGHGREVRVMADHRARKLSCEPATRTEIVH